MIFANQKETNLSLIVLDRLFSFCWLWDFYFNLSLCTKNPTEMLSFSLFDGILCDRKHAPEWVETDIFFP